MLALFCLRLASGLAAAMLLLPVGQTNPRFCRAHFLTMLGLTVGAAAFLWHGAGTAVCASLVASMVLTFLGSVIWSVDRAPGGRVIGPVTALSLAGSLILIRVVQVPGDFFPLPIIDDLTSAALLGLSTTAMLMGHAYLIAPAMSIKPLMRLLVAFFISLAVRAAVNAVGFHSWTQVHSLGKLDEVTLLLPLRWGIGIVGPAVLGFMAWQTARIRSTQSATGILYVVVIFCFLGELISQLLFQMAGVIL
jgi:hypothetical protein